MSTMVEINEGPELDKAVADAIGDEPGLPFSIARADCGGEGFTYKMFSTDLNAAFLAAKKVGLFDGSKRWLKQSPKHYPDDPVEWSVMFQTFRDSKHMPGWDNRELSRNATPALAICAAILHVMEALERGSKP